MIRAAAAFTVGKGAQKLIVLDEAQVEQLLEPRELLRELAASFGALARGEVQCPPRPQFSVPDRGFSLAMAAWQQGSQICVKVVNVFDGNLQRGLPNHLAIVNLFDPDTGAVTCVMDATYITGIRTAAAAVLSHQLLSRPDSRVATIVGAGVQAREHLRLLPLVRDPTRSRSARSSSRMPNNWRGSIRLRARCPRSKTRIRQSDLVCLATHSPTPVIEAAGSGQGRTSRRPAITLQSANCRGRSLAIIGCSSRRWTRLRRRQSAAPNSWVSARGERRRSAMS